MEGAEAMSLLNPGLVQLTQMKDSRWLTLEVCREYQRSKCTRTETECKFAHPPPHVEVQNGRVVCCYDSIKGKCQRKEPPCKYLHPPQHLREQLLQNGRNNLIIKNIQMQMLSQGLAAAGGQLIPITGPLLGGSLTGPAVASAPSFPNYMGNGALQVMGSEPLLAPQSQPVSLTNGSGSHMKVDNRGEQQQQQQQPTPSLSHSANLELPWWQNFARKRKFSGSNEEFQPLFVPPAAAAGMCMPPSYAAVPGGKRPALTDKSGVPLYQPAFQHLTAFQLPGGPATGAYIPTSFAGHVTAVPRY